MRRPKKASNFLRPYLSRKRKVKVSEIVMRTPPHNGILPLDNKYNDIAVPITSCISDPIMAISTIIHNKIRQTGG